MVRTWHNHATQHPQHGARHALFASRINISSTIATAAATPCAVIAGHTVSRALVPIRAHSAWRASLCTMALVCRHVRAVHIYLVQTAYPAMAPVQRVRVAQLMTAHRAARRVASSGDFLTRFSVGAAGQFVYTTLL